MVSIGCCLHHERASVCVGVLSVLWWCVVGLCVVGGQFLYGGCICAYTMRESIRLCGCALCPVVVCGRSVCDRWSVPLWLVCLCLYHERASVCGVCPLSCVVGVDGSV